MALAQILSKFDVIIIQTLLTGPNFGIGKSLIRQTKYQFCSSNNCFITDNNLKQFDTRVRFYNMTKCSLAYRYLQHHCQPFYNKLLSSHLDGQGNGKIMATY